MEKSLHESLDSAKLILTVSDFSRSEIIRLFNYPEERIVTTKLACSSDYIPRSPAECLPVLQKYQLAWQAYALYIGTMEPRKISEACCMPISCYRWRSACAIH